jgi:hypothetical protein
VVLATSPTSFTPSFVPDVFSRNTNLNVAASTGEIVPDLRDRFTVAEPDTPPECAAVEPARAPMLMPGSTAELAEV